MSIKITSGSCLVKKARQLAAFVVNKRFYEIGSSSGLAQFEALLSNHGGAMNL